MTHDQRHSTASNFTPVAAATESQLRLADETVRHHVAHGMRMPVRSPATLKISGRVLVATFLLPHEGTIDLEEGREWVVHLDPLH
jgi:hypothetical protein